RMCFFAIIGRIRAADRTPVDEGGFTAAGGEEIPQNGGARRLLCQAIGPIWVWEVGGGRTTRQPGQVRKEAALTSTGRVARQPPTDFTLVLSRAGPQPRNPQFA